MSEEAKQFIEKINYEYKEMNYYYNFFDEPGYIEDK